jgi:uncharacterized membrane protein YhaH (DUF805 family)
MQIQDAVDICVTQKYADFDGVARRDEFWLFYLFVVAISALMQASVPTLMAVFILAMAVPLLAVGTRRLHDVGRSGWWQLLWCVPAVGWLVLVVLFLQSGKSPTPPLGGATPPTSA